MKRIEIVSFLCTLILIVGGTFLAADKGLVSSKQTAAMLARSLAATVPAGDAVATAGGVVARPGALEINGCTVTAITDKKDYKPGEKVVMTVCVRNNSEETRYVEFVIVTQTYFYEEDSRMGGPSEMLETMSNNWVSITLGPGEEKLQTITLDGFPVSEESDNKYLISAVDPEKALKYIEGLMGKDDETAKAEKDAPRLTDEQRKELVLQAANFMAQDNSTDGMELLCRFKVIAPENEDGAYTVSEEQTDESK